MDVEDSGQTGITQQSLDILQSDLSTRIVNPRYRDEISQILEGLRIMTEGHKLVKGGFVSVYPEIYVPVVGRRGWPEVITDDFISNIRAGTFTPQALLSEFSNHDIVVFYSRDIDPNINPEPKSEWERRDALLQTVLPIGSEILFTLTPEQLREVFREQPRNGYLRDIWHKATNKSQWPKVRLHEATDLAMIIQTRIGPRWWYMLDLVIDDHQLKTSLLREQLHYGSIEQNNHPFHMQDEEEWGQWLTEFVKGR